MRRNPFDDLAADYEAWYATPLGAFVIAREEEALCEVLAQTGASHVLDIGAGTGWWARRLARGGRRVTALEPSEPMACLGQARSRGLDVQWVRGVAEALPFEPGTFDCALLFTVIEFVSDPRRALEEATRAVRAGGSVVIGYLEVLSAWAAWYRSLADQGVAPWTAARFVTGELLQQWMGRAPEGMWSSVWLVPHARPPFGEADRCGRRAGNVQALTLVWWRKL